jgi:hypothetical protein
MYMLAGLSQDSGLTATEIVADIPRDAGAVLVYVLLVVFIGFIWWGSRASRGAGAAKEPPQRPQPRRRGPSAR